MTSTPPTSTAPPTTPHETEADEGHLDIGAQDARQGAKTGHMRWVLGISLVLAVAAMSSMWIWHANTASTTLGAGAPRPSAAATRTVDSKPNATPNPALQ